MGREQLDPDQPIDYKETFNIGRDSIDQSNQWPQLPEFRSIGLEFFDACVQTADAVLEAIALALNLPPDFFTTRHSDRSHTLRLLHYPSHSDEALGAAAHTDYGSITLLFQDDIARLEVQTRTGNWIAAPPLADAVLVNLGDLMQRWTNDEYRPRIASDQLPTIATRSRFSAIPIQPLKLPVCP